MAESVFNPAECEVVSIAPLATIRGDGITRRVLLRAGGGEVVLFALDAGLELVEHTHEHHALVQVLTGSVNLVLDGKRRVLGPGEILHIPPRLPHALRANGATSLLLTMLPSVTIR